MKIAICGYGESGKDYVSNWLAGNTPLTYEHSTSYAMAKVVFAKFRGKYRNVQECYDDRRNHRQIWASIIAEYNFDDPARLYKEMIKSGDILNGIRRIKELTAVRKLGILDLSLWIERSVVPPDSTTDFGPNDCDIVIYNNGTIDDLNHKLKNWTRTMF